MNTEEADGGCSGPPGIGSHGTSSTAITTNARAPTTATTAAMRLPDGTDVSLAAPW